MLSGAAKVTSLSRKLVNIDPLDGVNIDPILNENPSVITTSQNIFLMYMYIFPECTFFDHVKQAKI